ncbi:MAG: caspase family protein [Cyanobacteria bacterium P01_A01_bin.17]
MKRRHFLQFSGSTLAALGLSHLHLEHQGLQYARVLAQDTPRKLALLVGVNRYAESARFINLRGCTTDVEMQRQLLIHRFKFHPNDIVTLSDESGLLPTRENILTGFEEHLIKQATPDSVVVFHFSGHGSRVLDSEPIHEDDLNSTFVPGDVEGDVEQVDDIMGRTLFLLMSALDTEQVTAVLDSCYAGGGTRGNVRIRAADGGRTFKASERELAYQEKWLSKLEAKQGIDRAEFFKRRGVGVAKGAVIAAAQREQTSADVTFDGFDAGAFTYLMTQFLWQQTDSLQSTVARVRSDTQQLSGQLPLLDTQTNASESVYFVPATDQTTPAEAVVTAQAENGEATIWLGGIHPDVLATFDRGTALNAISTTGSPLVITERDGLSASVSSDGALPVDTLLREQTRVLPKDLTLVLGIDSSLEVESTDICARVKNWQHIEAVIPDADGLYGTEVHYILGRMTAEYRARLAQENTGSHFSEDSLPEENSIGLFNQSLSSAIPESFRPEEEALQSSLNQLFIRVRSLLAARFIRAALNAQSSELTVQAQITSLESGNTIANVTTGRSNSVVSGMENRPAVESTGEMTHQLKTDERFQISITNHEDQPLYVSVVGVRPSGDLVILLPVNVSEPVVLDPRQIQQIPDIAVATDLTLDVPGYYEAMVLASKTPFTRALKGLSAIAQGERLSNDSVPNADLSGLNGLFEDFDTPRGEPGSGVEPVLAVDEIATLSVTIEAVES